jgi:hypothetical protein
MKKLIYLLTAAILIAMPIGAAHADPLTQDGARLENLLKREQILLSNQQERLNLANQIIAKADQWIADLKNRGKDTAGLETALATYKSRVAEAQTYLDTAKGVLDARAGFDADGKVTNRTDALKTVVEAGHLQRQFHLAITQATVDFRAAVLAYRQANK